MRLYLCPCCEQVMGPRTTPISDDEIRLGYALLLARGWTAERLLAERSEDLDGIAPGVTDFLRGEVAKWGTSS